MWNLLAKILRRKKKLMVVLGAGASVELGMPSVSEIDGLFHTWALEHFALAIDDSQSLYSHVRDNINRHYSNNPRPRLARQTNYEEVLYIIFQLFAILSDESFNFPMNAFLDMGKLPTIMSSQGERTVNGNDFRQLGFLLIDRLIAEFRGRCINTHEDVTSNFICFKDFVSKLLQDYDIAFISLNYDDLVIQAWPDLFTGFDHKGDFCPEEVHARADWNLIYHPHGSVHFDMRGTGLDMHAIKWHSDLTSKFNQNSFGRNSQETTEGIQMPTSVIVAGYGKAYQMQRLPFRTYYSQIDKIAEKSEVFLFIGYGFSGLHINNCFYGISQGPRRIVVIDWAEDYEDPMRWRRDPWSQNLRETIRNAPDMATRKFIHATPMIGELKENKEFEVSTDASCPLSIWYGGFMEACKNYDLIKDELEQ